jgi:hypothetical protein
MCQGNIICYTAVFRIGKNGKKMYKNDVKGMEISKTWRKSFSIITYFTRPGPNVKKLFTSEIYENL